MTTTYKATTDTQGHTGSHRDTKHPKGHTMTQNDCRQNMNKSQHKASGHT